jgi:putative ABC transport system permease protein
MNGPLKHLLQLLLQLWRRLLSLLRRGRLQREMEEEMRFHLEMQIEQNLEAGMATEEARQAAQRQFGNQTWLKEVSREMWSLNSIETLIQDLRYGARMLVKQPGFTLIAVLTLALGIGANTAIFSLVNATLLRRLPVTDPERLVYVFSGSSESPYNVFSCPNFAELRERNQVFEGLSAWGGITASLNKNGQGAEAELVDGAIVTGNYFEVLGVRAALGRLITPADDQAPGAHPVVAISHRLWQRQFGGDPAIVGREILLNGRSFTVIGVTPPEFGGARLGVTIDLYVPMMMQAVMRPPRAGYSGERNPDLLQVRGNHWLFGVGRLKPGVTGEQAQAALIPISQQQAEAFPGINRRRIVTLTAVNDGNPTERGRQISVAGLLMAVVGAVLLIACANVANLLLARASARRKEIAVRLSIGAGRWRIVRQLLTESLLLACLGGATGMFLAWWMVAGLKAAQPPADALPFAPDFAIDGRVLGFTIVLSLLAGIIFGLAPAWRATRFNLSSALKDEASAADGRTRRFSLRSALVVTQVALSLVLLIAAGLFLRSLRQAQAIEPGFDAERVLTAPLNINLLRYTRAQGRDFYRQVVERVEASPGVESASLARIVALSGQSSVRGLMLEGQTDPGDQFRSDGSGGRSGVNSVSSNVIGMKYFHTLGIPFARGRDFDAQDTEGRPGVVIVNEAFARRYLNGQEALSKRLSFNRRQGPWLEIVGVVRDSKYLTLSEAPEPCVYLPLAQNHETGMTLHVRTSAPPASLVAGVRQAVQSLEKNLPVTNVRPLDELLRVSLYAPRMGALLLGVFGALALLLAGVGLYGVMSFSVAQRTREIGVRMALGAPRRSVLRLVLGEGMKLVALGVASGLAVAVAVTQWLSSFLYGVSAMDIVTFASIPGLLAVVALLACWIPARRATKVDPLVALRTE